MTGKKKKKIEILSTNYGIHSCLPKEARPPAEGGVPPLPGQTPAVRSKEVEEYVIAQRYKLLEYIRNTS